MAATTASSSNGAVWSFGLGGMEEDESEDFSMFQPVAADDAGDAKEVEALEPTEKTLEESAEEEEEEADVVQPAAQLNQPSEPPHEASESSLEIEPAKPTSAVWSFGLGGTEDEDEDDDDEDGWGATVAPTTAPILEEGSQDEDEDDFVKEEEEKQVLATPPSTPPRVAATSAARQAQTPPSQLQQPHYSYSPEEDEPEESMEFIPVARAAQAAPASPAGFTINEDEEVNDTSMTFVSPVTPPKKSVGSVLGRRPQTVGSLSRPRFSTQIGRERMTPGSLLSKMTPKGAFKRASDIAAISHNKKQGDKQSRADRLMSIQSSFRHLDLNDSTSSMPNMSSSDQKASAEFKTPNNLLPPEASQDNEPEELSEHRDSDTSAAILPNAPMDSEDFESSRNTMTESSETSIDIVPTPPAEDLSPEQDAKKKKKSSKSKSPKGSRKTKKLDDEASTATKKKKKKGLKKAIKLATAPAVAMTELVRDTSTGMSDLVKSTAKEVSNRTSELGESLGMNNKNDKKKKKKSKTDDDATAASKKKKKPKSSKSLSPVPTTERKKKSKRKLVDGRQGLPTATERPLGNLEKQDSFGSNHSAQSCHSFS